MMHGGRIHSNGTYKDLLAQGGMFTALIQEYSQNEYSDKEHDAKTLVVTPQNHRALGAEYLKKDTVKLHQDEEREVGQIYFTTYMAYAKAMNCPFWVVLMLVGIALTSAARVAATLFLGYWTGNLLGLDENTYMVGLT